MWACKHYRGCRFEVNKDEYSIRRSFITCLIDDHRNHASPVTCYLLVFTESDGPCKLLPPPPPSPPFARLSCSSPLLLHHLLRSFFACIYFPLYFSCFCLLFYYLTYILFSPDSMIEGDHFWIEQGSRCTTNIGELSDRCGVCSVQCVML